jgi:hypothetical protein
LSGKQKYQNIVQEIRNDLEYIRELHGRLITDLSHAENPVPAPLDKIRILKLRRWITDIFIDKIFETTLKVKNLLKDLSLGVHYCFDAFIKASGEIIEHLKGIAFSQTLRMSSEEVKIGLKKLDFNLESYEVNAERLFVEIRSFLYSTEWKRMANVRVEDYVLPTKRNSYVSAREELEKAKQAVKDNHWDEVLNHLRPAIDLSIKEKFSFKKINPMKQFLLAAKESGLPLPTYTMLYDYFDEGSQRIHSGKLNTPFECQKALEFVAGFIDRLELIDVSEKQIEEFKQKCKCVE